VTPVESGIQYCASNVVLAVVIVVVVELCCSISSSSVVGACRLEWESEVEDSVVVRDVRCYSWMMVHRGSRQHTGLDTELLARNQQESTIEVYGLFVPWNFHTVIIHTIGGQFVPWQVCTMDFLYHHWTIHTIYDMDYSYHYWTFCVISLFAYMVA